ncbi:MAG: threonine/serine exporter family protein [bacterium]|nr:threonine/serine exporter family protein [bacterium]
MISVLETPEPTILRRDHRSSEAFLTDLARALHALGAPAHRLEASIGAVSVRLGLRTQVLTTPTATLLAFQGEGGARVELLRADPGEVSLARLADLSELIDAVQSGELDVAEARARVAAILERPARYGPIVVALAHALASGSAARLFGGSTLDVGVSAALGLGIGVLALTFGVHRRFARLFEPVAACVATVLAGVIASFFAITSDLAVLASLITIVPGFTLTVAMSELAERHLGAGTARFAGSAVSFLGLGLGVGLGRRLVEITRLPAHAAAELTSGALWSEALAVLVTPIAFLILFQARARDAGWIALAAFAGFLGARLGSMTLGPELGVFLGAAVVGTIGNALSRATGRPASTTQVPGIMLLLPGSLGFESVSYLLSSEVVSGVEMAFRALTVGGALVGGLLVANAIVPARREL